MPKPSGRIWSSGWSKSVQSSVVPSLFFTILSLSVADTVLQYGHVASLRQLPLRLLQNDLVKA